MGKKGVIILSGYNPRAVIAFLRVCDRCNVDYYIIATGKDDAILNTKYGKYVVYVRENQDVANLFEIAQKTMERYQLSESYFIPSTEYLNRYLINHREEFEHYNIYIPLVDKKLYEEISDKESFRNLCEKYSLPVTNRYENKDNIKYPCVLKPRKYGSSAGKPKVIYNKSELNSIYNHDIWFVEEYITGDSYYLLYYFRNDGSYICYSQKNKVQQPNGGSVILAEPARLHTHSICSQYGDMLTKENYRGLIMIEVKENDSGEFVMIEANPRLWGPSQLFVDAGINFFEEYLSEMGFVIDNSEDKAFRNGDIYYFWEGGVSENIDDLKYYSYSLKELKNKYHILKQNEIFNRDDTRRIYYPDKRLEI